MNETLTEEERALLVEHGCPGVTIDKLLRIHDAQRVTIANLEHRLGMATADPDSQSANLLSKHNALLMASRNLDAQGERIRELERQLQSLGAERDEWHRRALQTEETMLDSRYHREERGEGD